MMAEGRFASLPRSLHAHHHTLGGGSVPSTGPSTSLGGPSNGLCSPKKPTISMDLHGSNLYLPSGQAGSLSEIPSAAYQQVSLHGTLPRHRRGGTNVGQSSHTWDPKTNQAPPLLSGNALLPSGHGLQPAASSLGQNISDDVKSSRDPVAALDAAVDYVKFSRDQFILDCSLEKLRRELEEELKMNCEEPRSHAWYHGAIPRQVADSLVQRDGDFLVRDSLSSPGSFVLTCQWRNAAQHFKINRKVVILNEAYSRVEYRLDKEGFDSVPALVRYYVGNRKPVSQVVGAIIFQPINRAFPLRYLEEKYGLSSSHKEAGLMAPERRGQNRLSLNIANGHDGSHNVHDGQQSQDNGFARGSQLRLKERCGSQPASLNQVQEKRCPLKAHQSESFLPLGSKAQPQQSPDPLLPGTGPKLPVFRTGSEPVLSPSLQRRSAEQLAGQAIRGSDSQLCPKPPPKPSKVALARLPRSPCPMPPCANLAAPPLGSTSGENLASPWRNGGPPVPPVKPHKFRHFPPADSGSAASPVDVVPSPDSEAAPGRTDRLQPSPADRRSCSPQGPDWERGKSQKAAVCGYVERLTGDGGDEAEGQKALDRSSYHHAIAALESTSEEEEEEGEEGDIRRREKARGGFLQPVMETESTFRPSEFESRLLPPENKPLEMVVLKRAKELLLSHNHQSLARHLLMADCQVARILGVTPQLKGRMGVSSGLELVTLPHGRQLRLDLMERHHTMAIGVAVDILGCTGTVEERASTLNRIILVAMELKDAVGDLFAFAALMKALDMQQISRLEETWTTLRRNHTQTAISYEKILKPFYKSLYEGEASSPSVVCVPLLLPLLTLMERPSTKPEGVELWEISDQGCDIMLRHLEAARDVAHNARNYTSNAEQVLEGFQCDEDLLEVFKTDFQLRLLWGSRGAAVNQSDRYNKFNLILTALSRKLEPTTKTQAVI
ncbi:breast cancer anti-estrogen resistance protein 3 isoform X2 [Fundulus heteroclitus]|nr:breast cancer anti-estrogen resistance protein 3 isoform X2 [Fundulus heteroclitus]XP_035996716.1 breast cancer anti-estrogen resistance protein 3 isoform X2 [Fundulus heteroclitus]